MKTYLIFLFIPVIFVFFSHKSSQKKVKIETVETLEKSIDSLIKENQLIKEEIMNDVSIFKKEVDSINTITKTYVQELKNIKKDSTFIVDTTEVNLVKKKGWFKRTIDKIKNKE